MQFTLNMTLEQKIEYLETLGLNVLSPTYTEDKWVHAGGHELLLADQEIHQLAALMSIVVKTALSKVDT